MKTAPSESIVLDEAEKSVLFEFHVGTIINLEGNVVFQQRRGGTWPIFRAASSRSFD
jgi:hypothetical protein